MNFGEILNKWEKEKPRKKPGMETLLDTESAWKSFVDKDQREVPETGEKRIPIEDVIDLHGMTRAEAEKALNSFFDSAVRSGYRKVLIIHGKGNHSSGEGVLLKWVKKYLDNRPEAGKRGFADKENGGRGATWVMLK